MSAIELEVGRFRAEVLAKEHGRVLDARRVANETERMALRMLIDDTPTAPQELIQPVKAVASMSAVIIR